MPSDTTLMTEPEAESVCSDTVARPAKSVQLDNDRGGGLFVVDFHGNGNSAPYRTFGWSGQEPTHVWTVQASSGLNLPPPVEHTDLTMEIDLNVCSGHAFLSAAVLRVFVNRHPAGSARVQDRTRLTCQIPAAVLTPGQPIAVRFEHPCFVRPDFMDIARDDRALGLCFYEVRVFPPWMKAAVARFADKPADCRLIEATCWLAGDTAVEPVTYRFRDGAAGQSLLGEGWRADPNGDIWADDRVCSLELPAPPGGPLYVACFTFCPLYIRGFKVHQRITILLSNAVIGQFTTGIETSLTVPLPPELVGSGREPLRFAFVLPDGMPMHMFQPGTPPYFLSLILDSIQIAPLPARDKALANVRYDNVSVPVPLAVSDRFLDDAADDLPDLARFALGREWADILRQFESIGDNCSFGLAQRKAGCEVLGLLRFGNAPLRGVLAALDDEFRAAGDKNQIRLQVMPDAEGEYGLYIDRYGIRWHTDVFEGQADEATIFAQQTMRLAYLRRKFYEGLRAGRKIFTIARAEPRKHPITLAHVDETVWEERPEPLRLAEVLPVFDRLNRYGTNTMLYLTPCEHGRRCGTVELVAPGIMRGYVDSFVITPNIADKDHAAWLRVAANAWLLDQGPNAVFRQKDSA